MEKRSPILCLEGGLAVGKSSTAQALAEQFGAFVVPEMNRLFRPVSEDPNAPDRRSFGSIVAEQPPGWYLERQAERWALADAAAYTHPLVVLDRDPFQPLWYRWAFRYEGGGQTPEDLATFYRPRLAAGSLRFPDRYVLLTADIAELRQRKENDPARDRRGFDRQLRFVEPQKRYFAAMHTFAPGRVLILPAHSIAGNIAAIAQALPALQAADALDSVALFDRLTAWLAVHSPED